MKLLTVLLYPFAALFNLVTAIRNRLYDLGFKPSATFDVTVIGVGNLSVGGTGKTPMIEHLVRLLKSDHKVATLSRGYKRNTKGFRFATADDSAMTLGDEPFQFYKKFKNDVVVSVGEERAMAIPQILDEYSDTNVVLLDDAYQHRKVKPSFQLLLTDHGLPFYKDFLLPAGRLRESRKGAQRADAVVVTKCPVGIGEEEMMSIERNIRKYSDKPVFFTAIRYGDIVAMNNKTFAADHIVLVSGIANAEALKLYVNDNYDVIKHFEFPDHHVYTASDIKEIVEEAKNHQAVVLTTEKDAVKIASDQWKALLSETPCFYLPIEIEFLKNGKDFDEMILNAVKNA